MALTVSYLGVGSAGAAVAAVSVTSVTASAGDFLFAFCSARNMGTNGASSITSVTDSSGNTWINEGTYNYDPGAADAGHTIAYYACKLTSALSAGSVTLNLSPSSGAVILIFKITPTSALYNVEAISIGTGSSSASAGSRSITTASVAANDVVFCTGLGSHLSGTPPYPTFHTADADTTNGSWSTVYERTSNTLLHPATQYKIVTGAGTQTWTYDPDRTGKLSTNYITFTETLVGYTYTHDGEGGAYTVGDTPADLLYGRIFIVDTTSYSISGTDATTVYAKAIYNDGAGYTVTGATANLTKGGVPSGYTYSVNSGTYTVSGTDATFNYTYKLTADFGSYGVDGAIAQLTKGRTLAGDTAAYSVSGTANNFLYGRVFTADGSSYLVSGVDNSFRRGYTVVGATASYSVTGDSVVFGAGQRRFSVLSGAYTVAGKRAAVYWNPGSTYTLVGPDPSIKFWSNPDGLVVSYPRLISFLKYIRRPTNINGNGNIMVTTDAGSGLFSSVGHLRVTLVDGSSYVGIFAADDSVNALLITDPNGEPDQLFDPCGALRIIEASVDNFGAYAPNGALYVVNLK